MVTALFADNETARVHGLWQWDYGQILRIQGLSLDPAVEIHFSLSDKTGESITRIGVTKDGVTEVVIPESMLENGETRQNYNIYAWIYLADESSGKTIRKIVMSVTSRPKPEAFQKPEDAQLFRDAIKAVNDSATRSAEFEKQAEGWAHGREDLPERAEDNAKYYADQAHQDAEKTKTDRKEVERLVESVSDIDQQVSKVEDLTKQVQTSATNAALSEQAAKTAETNAQTAQAGAETAEGNAELAERNAKASEQAVEKAKQLVSQMGQDVLENKNHVDQTVHNFDLTTQQTLADVNNAGQTQTERVQSAGETAVENIQIAQNTATKAVETAKAEAVEVVQTEGSAQTENVTKEGEKQVQAVRTAAQEIVADREQIQTNKAGIEALKQGKADAIVDATSGENITLTDSDAEPFRGLRIFGKSKQSETTGANLFDANTIASVEGKGIKVVNNLDGSISFKGTATERFFTEPIRFNLPNGNYYVSGTKNNISVFYSHRNQSAGESIWQDIEEKTFAVTDGYESRLYIVVEKGKTVDDTVFPMINKGTSPLPFEPYTGGNPSPSPAYPQKIESVGKNGDIVIDIYTKNLYNINEELNGYVASDGSVYGSVPEKNEKYNDYVRINQFCTIMCATVRVTIPNKESEQPWIGIGFYDEEKKFIKRVAMHGTFKPGIQVFFITASIPENAVYMRASYRKYTDGTLQIEYGSVSSAYEEYKHQSLTLQIPNGLPGIKVDKDGNYTDSNGQQWVCDEIDLERGKYVQRVAEKDVLESQNHWPETGLWGNVDGGSTLAFLSYINGTNGEKNWDAVNQVGMCNYFVLKKGVYNNSEIGFSLHNYIAFRVPRTMLPDWDENNPSNKPWIDWLRKKKEEGKPLKIQYALAIPIERDLTQEEISSYKALHTNYPTTIISNDENAGMEVSYVADAKNYIAKVNEPLQKQITELQKALISQKISGGGIKVSDSANVPVVKFGMWGKTEQVQTTGKNLVDISDITIGTEDNIECLIEKNIYISCRESTAKTSNNVWRIKVENKDGTLNYIADNSMLIGKKIVASVENPITCIYTRDIYIQEGAYSKIQVEYGDSVTAYEPYTGGKPSPSPEYPQSIEVTDHPVIVTIKGETEQQSITLVPPRPFTKWDKLEKIDGVWQWVYQSKKYTITGDESFVTGGNDYFAGTSMCCYIIMENTAYHTAASFMNRLRGKNLIWSVPSEIGYSLNSDKLHIRLPYEILGSKDTDTIEEKKRAYVNFMKQEYDTGNPFEIFYKTNNVEHIPLSQSEQDKLNSLTMYALTTELTNDGGCTMELTYTVDTKSYVDTKIAEISTAIVQKGI